MTTPDNPQETFRKLLRAIQERLTPVGYTRRGSVFRHISHENCGIIDVQRSDKSSKERVVFTVNLGIVCGELLEPGILEVRKTGIMDAHLRQRIGMLLPDRCDKWWEVTESTHCESLKQELVELLLTKGVPYIEGYLETKTLVDLWESGQSPGLTAFQRARFLSRLGRDS